MLCCCFFQFEQDILSRKFVEHGEYQKAYYGTSLEAITDVVRSEKICVLNLHPQSLKMLKQSRLMPYVVFVAPPSLEKVRNHYNPTLSNSLPFFGGTLLSTIFLANLVFVFERLNFKPNLNFELKSLNQDFS